MKKYDLSTIGVVAGAVIVGLVLSSLIIKGPVRNAKVVHVTAFPSAFPDVKNDPTYKNFLNPEAFDPTQSVRVGGSQNSTPFNGGQ